MEFALTEEQQQLQDALRRYLDKTYTFDARRTQLKSDTKISATHWAAFAEFGLLGLSLPEECGGTGSATNVGGTGVSAEDTMIVMSSFGRALVVEPYLATVVLCGRLLGEYQANARCANLLSGIAEGKTKMALAVHERAGRYQLSYVGTSAKRDADGSYVLNGAKAVVVHGDVADTFVVSARTRGTSGAIGDEGGISLFLIDRNTTGLVVRGYPTNDGLSAADITLDNVRLDADALVGDEHAAYPQIERVIGFGIAALCAEAVGAMEALGEQTLEYLKNRKQFGVAIGTFQALQHRMVDMFIATEQARSITMLATLKADAADINERRRVIAAAKSLVGQSARYVGQQAVQLHGGMGVTDELAISHYFKRLTAIDMLFGDAHYQRGQLGDLMAA
jgi:alkylation response protein AidB-like acyl-CoA dehydrogenase